MRRAPFLALAIAVAGSGAQAQTTYGNEFWPDLRLEHRFDDRTKAIVLGSYNRDRDSGSVYQAEVGYTLDHRFTDFSRAASAIATVSRPTAAISMKTGCSPNKPSAWR